MKDTERQIEELTRQLVELKSRQQQMNNEMRLLEKQLESLIAAVAPSLNQAKVNEPVETPATFESRIPYVHQLKRNYQNTAARERKRSFHLSREMEDFIGANVISKIGILVTIIGVFIGAKYAIDNELISPAVRIIAGYSVAAALVFVALRLKKKYEYFSSVLAAGGLSVAYFITYIAFSFYSLLPMLLAFVIMLIITAAAVGFALWYNQKVIALIGQVAAYAIPFLLGSKSGNVFGLFAYISFINIGLLLLSFKKDWKVLYHLAFFLTWFVYLFWLLNDAAVVKNFALGLTFLTINFFTFYITFLSYKIFKKEQYRLGEIGILLLNALFYFFLGMYLIGKSFQNIHFLTWFTLSNACIHFVAGYFIYRLKLADSTVFQFVTGLGLLFVTVAIPIELDGSWVTLLWTVEAVALFFIAHTNKRYIYLDIALPLVIIAVISLLQDWSNNYSYLDSGAVTHFDAVPFANINFWRSVFECTCLAYISYTAVNNPFSGVHRNTVLFFNKIVPVAFLFIFYFTLYSEIHFAWDKLIQRAGSGSNTSFMAFQSITLIIFSCLYVAIWLFNGKIFKKKSFLYLLLAAAAVANIVFLTKGLYSEGELRENYISKAAHVTFSSILFIRYLSFISVALLWISARRILRTSQTAYSLQVAFSSFFNLTLLSVISNEFIQWMDISGCQNQYKLGLSLIWGSYGLALIFIGIVKNKKHLRIAAMILFSITLFKLFFYDLASLSTISKTVVLVLLGILLLSASFLYNKHKDVLAAKEEN